jgi:ureidoglycolate hydrolase
VEATGYQISAAPLSEGEWEPFGWIPVADTDPRDGSQRLAFDWADAHLNVISHTLNEIDHDATTFCCDRLYRHLTHTQALTPLDTDAVIAVAPPAWDFDASGVRAFMLHPLETLVLHKGTWHWGPFPVGRASVSLLNLQGLRYAEDNDCVDLAEKGFTVSVLVGAAPLPVDSL